MAKQPQTSNTPEESKNDVKAIEVSEFKDTPVMKKSSVILKRGEILIAELDDKGNEVNEFVSNQKTFDDFYSKNSKFKIKKK
ncbi:hypothetical protein ACFQO9_11325 [Chryseobacterium zhengzhouense]|uniref:Uncharacterized protein n=1 Tax=Chryseobacterium zhengzhouense TaxID=1636086 RepID=A0ABW2M1C5_9FLAO